MSNNTTLEYFGKEQFDLLPEIFKTNTAKLNEEGKPFNGTHNGYMYNSKGQLSGPFIEFPRLNNNRHNGVLTGVYKDGEKHGLFVMDNILGTEDKDGPKLVIEEYNQGKLDGVSTTETFSGEKNINFHEEGVLRHSEKRFKGNLVEATTYYPDGAKQAQYNSEGKMTEHYNKEGEKDTRIFKTKQKLTGKKTSISTDTKYDRQGLQEIRDGKPYSTFQYDHSYGTNPKLPAFSPSRKHSR